MGSGRSFSAESALPKASPTEVLRELRAVCGSAVFQKSSEAFRLLHYLVEAEQAGETDKLREVLIGAALYGREANYDPKLDSVVRVNATRLRARLEEHYAGRPEAALRIVVPKGSYVPVYEWKDEEWKDEGASTAPPEEYPQTEVIQPAEPIVPNALPVAAVAPFPPGRFAGWKASVISLCAVAVCWGAAWTWWSVHRQQAGSGIARRVRPFSRMAGVEEFPEFSPDGKSVVFAWANTGNDPPRLYTQDVTSDAPRLFGGVTGPGTRPAWSPDGQRLAFVRPLDKSTKRVIIKEMPNGPETEVATLRGNEGWLCEVPKLSWSSDGRELFTAAAAAESSGTAEYCRIVAIDVERRTVRTVTEAPTGSLGDVEATVSPDGRTVAFLRKVSHSVVDLYLVGPQGGETRRATFNNRDIVGMAWERGGRSLVLAERGEDGTVRLTERNLETGGVTLLTDGTAAAAFPAIERSSGAIVFTSYRSTANIHLVSTSGDVELIGGPSDKGSPQLSPDGRRLAYTSDRTGYKEVWISDADGKNGVRLTHTGATGAHLPLWLPDGRSLLFECRDQQHSQICLVDVDGRGEMRRLTQAPSEQILPSLSHDGRSLYYASNRTGRWETYSQAMPDGDPVQLTSGGSVHAVKSWNGRTLYIDTGVTGLGFVVAPSDAAMIHTTEANSMVHPDLRFLLENRWEAGPGGIVYCRRTKGKTEFVLLDDGTWRETVLWTIHGGDEVDTLSVAPDGASIVYATRARSTGEINMLEPVP